MNLDLSTEELHVSLLEAISPTNGKKQEVRESESVNLPVDLEEIKEEHP